MKPFNLDEALAGKPVVTRDGRPVKIAGYNDNAKRGNYILGWIDGVAQSFYADGCISGNFELITDGDLFMAPSERKEWVVRVEYPNPNKPAMLWAKTEDEAKTIASKYSDATIHEITIIE